MNMMLPSVLCYNLLKNIKENDLKYIELPKDYGQVSMKETHQKSFQKLFYIIRDWSPLEVAYGQHKQQKINEMVVADPRKLTEVQGLRTQIESNFDEVNAFLLPYPGNTQAQNSLNPVFIKYIKELVPLILAPENLSIRTINGKKMQAHHFASYLNEMSKIFNRKTSPNPRNLLMVSAELFFYFYFFLCLHSYSEKLTPLNCIQKVKFI